MQNTVRERMKKMNLVQNTLSRFVSSGQIAGCAVRIMRNDEVSFEGSFGYADIEKKVPMSSENTIFPIASMSKVVTVAGIMQLYEQGLFKMWDPVSEFLPGYKELKVAKEKPDGTYEIVDAKGQITMRQLFTMTSGIPYPWADTAAAYSRCFLRLRKPTNTFLSRWGTSLRNNSAGAGQKTLS